MLGNRTIRASLMAAAMTLWALPVSWAQNNPEMAVSPGLLTEAQRGCLVKASMNSVIKGISNIDAIERCQIPNALIGPAISMLGNFSVNGDLMPTPWTRQYCRALYVGFECEFRGVAVDFTP